MKEPGKKLPVLAIRHFKQNQPEHPDFYIQTVREHVQDNAFVNTPHRHDFYLIVFFVRGSGLHTIDFTTYDIRPGSVFFMSPAQMHRWELSDDADGYILFFNPSFYLLDFNQKKLFDFPFFSTLGYSLRMQLQSPRLEYIIQIIEYIHEEFTGQEPRKEEVIRSFLDILLIKLSGSFRANQSAEFSPHLAHQVRQLEILIEQHFSEHKSVAEYADLMHLSAKQLNAICKNALGKPVSELIQARVILEAKRLLRYTDQTVAQIAFALNYPDDSYFNRFFRKVTGLTPEGFRLQGRLQVPSQVPPQGTIVP